MRQSDAVGAFNFYSSFWKWATVSRVECFESGRCYVSIGGFGLCSGRGGGWRENGGAGLAQHNCCSEKCQTLVVIGTLGHRHQGSIGGNGHPTSAHLQT